MTQLTRSRLTSQTNMEMTEKQIDIKNKIETIATLLGIDKDWAVAVAMTESSLGLHQKSVTGCLGVFQMSSVAMIDLLKSMETPDDDWTDIVCGVAFLRLLLRRWKTLQAATDHFCDPKDRPFYWNRVFDYMSLLKN